MNPNPLKLLEKHVEKCVLGMAIGFLAVMVAVFGIRSPNRVTLGERLTPGELSGAILDDAVELKRRMTAAVPEPVDSAASREFARRLMQPPTLPSSTVIVTAVGRPVEIAGQESDEPTGSIELIRPRPPASLTLATGRNLVTPLSPAPADPARGAAAGDAGMIEMTWVSVGGYFDLAAQQAAIHQAHYEAGRARIYITGTDVERRELVASGVWSDWVRVERGRAMPRLDIPTPVIDERGRLLNSVEMNDAWRTVRDGQLARMQPPFPTIIAGPEWSLPPLFVLPEADKEAEPGPGVGLPPSVPPTGVEVIAPRQNVPNPAQMKKDAAQKLAAAKQALARSDQATARVLIDAVLANQHASDTVRKQAERIREMLNQVNPRPPTAMPTEAAERMKAPGSRAAVWFHDDSVEPGKTYQYRMRVNLWNRYLGRQKALKNGDDARKAIVEGEWSAPSEPILVAPDAHFFLTSLKPGTEAAVVEVWRWRKGRWHKHTFEVSVGEVIGGQREIGVDEADAKGGKTVLDFTTGALVLDLRSDEPIRMRLPGAGAGYQLVDRRSVVMVYVDPADGQVKERIADVDRANPVRKRLLSAEK